MLLSAIEAHAAGTMSGESLRAVQDAAVGDTIRRLEETGSPNLTDGEQSKPSFATYPSAGLELAPDGVTIPFADGKSAERDHRVQREAFLADLVSAAKNDIRECLDANAACVQIDFTEGRLARKLDPSGGLLRSFAEPDNRVLSGFSNAERQKIGVHTCPGGDRDSTHSADVDYTGLSPELFQFNVGRFYIQRASEKDHKRVLKTIAGQIRPGQVVFVGVTDPSIRK